MPKALNRVLFLLLIMLSFVSISKAQVTGIGPKPQKYAKKYDRKVIISPFAGVGFIPGNSSFDQYGNRTNLYSSFFPPILAGIGAYYPMKFYPRLMAHGEYATLLSWQQYYFLNINTFSLGGKFLLRDRRKKLNPYVGLGIGLPIGFYFQEAHNEEFIPEEGSTDIDFGEPLKFEKRIPQKSVFYGPGFSPYFSAGVQYKIDRKYSVFLQAQVNPVLGGQGALREEFPVHRGRMDYITGRGGVNIQLMKPKPPYVDTAMIPIPDPLIALSVPEDFLKQGMLVREGVFDIQLREGMKHNIRLEVGAHELIAEETVQDPCKVVCYLYDEKGDIIARAESTPEGKIVFSDIQNGIYDLTFVLEKPCTSANFKYKFPDPSVHTLMQYNEDGTIHDSLYYNIEGNVIISDTIDMSFVYKSSPLFLASNNKMLNNNYDIAAFLCDTTRKMINKYEPQKNEKFYFKRLFHKKYEVIYKAPDVNSNTTLNYAFVDNYKYISQRFTYTLSKEADTLVSEEDKFYEKLRHNLRGKVILKDTLNKMQDVTLYLVNNKKKIVNFKKPEKDGTFLFKNLKSKVKYDVYYELEDSKGKIDITYKPEEIVPLPKANLDDVDVIGRRRRLVPDLPTPPEGKVLTYSPKGSLINPKGYGVYVGAFENITNVDLICKKLIKDGYDEICIQVGMTEKMNKKYEFTRNFKIHKVLIGDFDRERQAIRAKNHLEYLGYDTYIIKYDNEQSAKK